jgi:hypothetical protein
MDGNGLVVSPAELVPARNRRMGTLWRARINLTTLRHVRTEMSRLYRDARAGLIDTQDASRLAFVLVHVGKMIELELAQVGRGKTYEQCLAEMHTNILAQKTSGPATIDH